MAVATNWFDSHSFFLCHQPIYNDIFIFSQALACIFGGVARSAPPPPAAEDMFFILNE